jgi:hypothetical protein
VRFDDEAAATAALRGACEQLRAGSVDQPEGHSSPDAAGELDAQAQARRRKFEERQRQAEEAGTQTHICTNTAVCTLE